MILRIFFCLNVIEILKVGGVGPSAEKAVLKNWTKN